MTTFTPSGRISRPRCSVPASLSATLTAFDRLLAAAAWQG